MTAPEIARPIPIKVLALLCGLGLASFVSPWFVYVDWSSIRPLYLWDFVEFVDNGGGAEELARISIEVMLVAALAAAIGVVAHRRPFQARPILLRSLLFAMVGALLVSYGALLVGADLATLLIVAVDGGGLTFWRRAGWLSGPTMRATAVLASLASAWIAMGFARAPAS